MLIQLIIGTFVICGTVLIQAMFIGVLSKVLANINDWLLNGSKTLKMILVVTAMGNLVGRRLNGECVVMGCYIFNF